MSGVDLLLRRMRPTWVEIDLGAWRRNLEAARGRLPIGAQLVPVLKADGYGHGAVELAGIAVGEGLPLIAVALLEEALEIRKVHPDAGVLILGPLEPAAIDIALRHDMQLGVTGPEQLELIAERTAATGREAAIHLKLDSGMGRMGLIEEDLARAIEVLRRSPAVIVRAIYTHFATADDRGHPAFEMQDRRFDGMLDLLRRAGVAAPLHHRVNSAAIWRSATREGDLARAGLLLLGGEVLAEAGTRLEPVLRWRTSVARLKRVARGEGVGYGHAWTAQRPSRIATLPVGYADGYDRGLSNRAEVLIRGRRAPVVGRVSMDLVTVDVTDVPDAALGDEVVLLGRQGSDEIPAEELAGLTGTIAYEVFCSISGRVPRVWVDGAARRVGSRFGRLLSEDES